MCSPESFSSASFSLSLSLCKTSSGIPRPLSFTMMCIWPPADLMVIPSFSSPSFCFRPCRIAFSTNGCRSSLWILYPYSSSGTFTSTWSSLPSFAFCSRMYIASQCSSCSIEVSAPAFLTVYLKISANAPSISLISNSPSSMAFQLMVSSVL